MISRVIEQSENESVISSVAVHNRGLNELAGPLLSRGYIPRQVTVYAAQRAASHAAGGRALIIYRGRREARFRDQRERQAQFHPHARCGRGRSSLQRDLPQLALSAELQGIDTSFPTVLLDENCLPLRDTIERVFAQRPDLMRTETPPATVKLESRARRAGASSAPLSLGREEWRKRLLWAGGIYARHLPALRALRCDHSFPGRPPAKGDQARRSRRSTSSRIRRPTGKRSRRRSIRIITRSKSCSIFSKACRILRCGSRFTISLRAIFRSRAKRPRPHSPISLPRR